MVGACPLSCLSHALPRVRSFSGLIIPEELSPSCGRPDELARVGVGVSNVIHRNVNIRAI